jgi:Uma2 family endonuclease
MTTPATKLTYQDYLLLPDDGKRYEILDGELYMTPPPATRHQLIAFRLSQAFGTYPGSSGLGYRDSVTRDFGPRWRVEAQTV